MGRTKTLTTRFIMDAVGVGYTAAYKRKKRYENGEITKDEALAPSGALGRRIAITRDGTKYDADILMEIKGCNRPTAYKYIQDHNDSKIDDKKLLQPIYKKRYIAQEDRPKHKPRPLETKERLHNLNKIPEPSAWERDNML